MTSAKGRVALPEMYEFHVDGLIGPVVAAALPELTTQAPVRQSVLTGTASEPAEVDNLLHQLRDHGLVTQHIVIARDTRWQDTRQAADDQLP